MFKGESAFSSYFRADLRKCLHTSNEIFHLMLWAKTNYRAIMLVFIATAIALHHFATRSPSQAGIAVMARYALQLADYVYHFTVSLGDTRARAISIERIRRYTQDRNYSRASAARKAQVETKIRKMG